MSDMSQLAAQFEESRQRLRAIAVRMLGSEEEADDAVQETWLRLSRVDAGSVDNLGGWLTTVVARVCLDALRARGYREDAQKRPHSPTSQASPENELQLADSIGSALLVVLATLEPAERVAFVLHDMFDVSFDEIAAIVGRTPGAARQLASRGRRRVRGGDGTSDPEPARQREVVSAFLAASREGDFGRLLAVLNPDVVFRADNEAIKVAGQTGWGGQTGLPSELHGADAVAALLKGRARGVQLGLIDGRTGAIWSHGGRTLGVWLFEIEGDQITSVEVVLDPERLTRFEIVAAVQP